MAVVHILVLILVGILTAIYAYFKISFNYWKSRNVPHDPPTIPHGNIKGMGVKCHQSVIWRELYHRYKGAAKFCGVYLFTRPVALLLDLDLIKCVLVRDFGHFNDRGIYYNEKDDPISAHLGSLEGEKWRMLRAKLTPTFTSAKMKFMFPTIVGIGERLRDRLQHTIVKANDEVEISELLRRYTTDVVGTCAFGIEFNCLNDENAEFYKFSRLITTEARHHVLVQAIITSYRGLARKLGIRFFRDDVSAFFLNVVRETVEKREQNNIHRNDFMDLLIKLKNEESDEKKSITFNELAAQAFIFFLAGFETSSTTLTYCLYELALNPDVQVKARQEIQKALQRHNGQFTYEAMMDMPFIDHVIHETLRKHPPVTAMFRRAQSDYKVPGTDHVIEKDTTVFVPVFSIQHDPEYFPSPEIFDPDRFQSEKVKQRDLMTWLPFGEGPRNCIGLRFGMMQTRVALVKMLMNFELSASSKTEIPPVYAPGSFALAPKDGVYLKMKSINEEF